MTTTRRPGLAPGSLRLGKDVLLQKVGDGHDEFRAPQVIEQVRPGPSVAMAEPEKLAVLGELESHVES